MQKLMLSEVDGGRDSALLTEALDCLTRSVKAAYASPLGKIEAIRAAIKGLCLKEDWDEARIHATEALDLLPLGAGATGHLTTSTTRRCRRRA